MKTIEQWLNELPEPYRSQAFENCGQRLLSLEESSFKYALATAFIWELTTQGHEYWRELANNLPTNHDE